MIRKNSLNSFMNPDENLGLICGIDEAGRM